MEISIDQAKALCQIVDDGGYAKAAQSLHKSHSSLVYMIKTLEVQCGFPLFDRKQYRSSLTIEGQRVYNKSKEILKKIEELSEICSKINQGWESSIKVVFDGILPLTPFLDLYKQIKAEKIPTVIQTYTNYLDDVGKMFDQENADVMIEVIPSFRTDVQRFELSPISIFLVAHKDHPLNKSNKKWTLNELQDYYFLTVHGSAKNLKLNTFEFEESATFFLSDFSFKKEAILNKLGFGWLPEHMIESELKNKILVPIKWERKNKNEIQPVLSIRKSKLSGPAIQKMKSFLTEKLL